MSLVFYVPNNYYVQFYFTKQNFIYLNNEATAKENYYLSLSDYF